MLASSARAPDHPSSQNQHRHADHHTSFEHNIVTKYGSIYSCVLRFQGGCVLGSQLLQRSLQRLALESCDRIHLRSRGRPPPPHVRIPQARARQGMSRTLARPRKFTGGRSGKLVRDVMLEQGAPPPPT